MDALLIEETEGRGVTDVDVAWSLANDLARIAAS
jgi:hypothetical protein